MPPACVGVEVVRGEVGAALDGPANPPPGGRVRIGDFELKPSSGLVGTCSSSLGVRGDVKEAVEAWAGSKDGSEVFFFSEFERVIVGEDGPIGKRLGVVGDIGDGELGEEDMMRLEGKVWQVLPFNPKASRKCPRAPN